jgi:hypothetical protein
LQLLSICLQIFPNLRADTSRSSDSSFSPFIIK